MSRLVVAVAALLLVACSTRAYAPAEHPLRAGLISQFTAAPTVILNAQPSSDPVIVYDQGAYDMAASLHDITELMVRQAIKELERARRPVDGDVKIVNLKVLSLLSTQQDMFFWRSRIDYQVTLGDREPFTKSVTHASANVLQDLNGCIAEGVMELLNDERVRAYLGS